LILPAQQLAQVVSLDPAKMPMIGTVDSLQAVQHALETFWWALLPVQATAASTAYLVAHKTDAKATHSAHPENGQRLAGYAA
jgi:hypothetical protein